MSQGTYCFIMGLEGLSKKKSKNTFWKTKITKLFVELIPGNFLQEEEYLVTARVVSKTVVNDTGIYAPLTTSGDIVVNGIYASCHAVLHSNIMQSTFFEVFKASILRAAKLTVQIPIVSVKLAQK